MPVDIRQINPYKTDKQKQDKFAVVMREFEKGNLKSSSGEQVTDRSQAMAIAASEAGLSEKRKG